MIKELVVHHERVLNHVLDNFGDNTKSHMVSEKLCNPASEDDKGCRQLAKMAVVVKGDKVRLIHMRKNGTNSKVTFQELPVLPKVKNIVGRIMELVENKDNNEGAQFLTLDFRDAFE